MKKVLKLLGGLAILGAAVAGGIALYQKFFCPEDYGDLDDELEDAFEDEEEDETAERSYVHLDSTCEGAAAEAEKTAKAAEEAEAAADAVAEEAKETVANIEETLAAAAEKAQATIQSALE